MLLGRDGETGVRQYGSIFFHIIETLKIQAARSPEAAVGGHPQDRAAAAPPPFARASAGNAKITGESVSPP